MSITTFSVTDEARSGVPLEFLHPEYRSSSSGVTRATHKERSDGDIAVHPLEWDANVYPCPECLSNDTRVDAAVSACAAAAEALRNPSHEWENIRVTSYKCYELLKALWDTVDAKATIYDRKDMILHLIGARAAQCFYNVALVWMFRAARQQAVSVATTVRRWEEAAGLFDELLQSPLGKDTQQLELSSDSLRTLCCVSLAAAHEVALVFYQMDVQHMHTAVVDLAHGAEFYYGLAESVVSQSGSVPNTESWQNFISVKAEFCAGMTFYLSSLEPETKYGESRRRRAQECFATALETAEAVLTSARAVVSTEINEAMTKCEKFRSWKRKGWIRECVETAVPFRNQDAARLASWDVTPYEGIVARSVPKTTLRRGDDDVSADGHDGSHTPRNEEDSLREPNDNDEEELDLEELENAAVRRARQEQGEAVMRGEYGVSDNLLRLTVTTVPQDLRKAAVIRCVRPGEANKAAAKAIVGALRRLSVSSNATPSHHVDHPPHEATAPPILLAGSPTEVVIEAPEDELQDVAPQQLQAADEDGGGAEGAVSGGITPTVDEENDIAGELLGAPANENIPTTPTLDTIRLVLEAEEEAERAAERARKIAKAAAKQHRSVSGDDSLLGVPFETAPYTLVQVAVQLGAVQNTLSEFHESLRLGNNGTLTRCAAVFVIDINHQEKAKAEKLRNAVVVSLQSARFGHGDRVGIVTFDPVDATPSVIMVQATEANLKKLASRILHMKGRGKFAHSHGTPIISGVAAALDALQALDEEADDVSYDGNRHIFIVSNGEDRTEESDQLDWQHWCGGAATLDGEDEEHPSPATTTAGDANETSVGSIGGAGDATATFSSTGDSPARQPNSDGKRSEPAIRRRLRKIGAEVHTAAITFAADDALLTSVSTLSKGCAYRVLQQPTDDDQYSVMELQKFLTTTLCSAVARVAGHITLTIAAAPPAKVEGSSPITASLLANGGVCVVAVESDHEIYPVLPKITESEILAATANNLDSEDVVGSAEKKKRASIAGIAPTPIYSLSGAVVSTKVPILPIAVGQSSSLLVTFAVPITHIQQDVLHLANLTLAFRQNGVSAKSPSELVLPVIHVNTTRVEDISLHSRLRQVSVDAFSGSGHILTTGPNGLFVVKGHEVLCEGDSIRTGSAEDHASLSLITIGGTRLDLGPSTEVRIDKVTKKELVCHLLSGKLVVTTPCDQTVIVKCEGYETAVDGAATVRISFVAEPTVLYEVKTLSGRCVATNLAIAALPATPQPTPQQLPLSLQHSAAAGAGAALPKGSVEVLASRQTTTHHQPDGALSTPWLVEFTKEEVEEILGTDGNQQPQHTAPSSQRNLSGTPGALSLAALSAASPAVSARGDVSPSQVSPSLAGRLSPALSDLSVLQAAPPRAAVKLPASRGATAASKSHAALRASMVVDTIKCRFEVIRMLDVMQRKYSLRLAKFSAPQTSVVRRARTFLIGAELSFARNRLANSVAYICSTNNALDSWRGAFEAYTHFVRLTAEDDDSTARTADGDDQRAGTPSSSGGGAGGANEKLCWWHVDDIAQMKRAIATERPLSISMPNLFETTDILEQRALVIKDKDDRRDAAKLLRLEEQLLTRQSEENRREFALIRLFQLFQWNGFETVWVKDVLSVLTTVPRAKLFLSISSRAISILEAVGVLKSLTDEQFATALGVACKDLTPAEFTAFMDLLSRRAVAVQDDVEASVESRAFYSFAQALGIGSRGPLCHVESLLELIQRNLSRRTTWTSTANVDSTSEEALQRRWDRFLDALSSTLQKLQFEVVQTPLRRKSTASMLKRSGSLLNTSNLPSTPTDTVGGGAADVMLSIIPEEEEDENGDDRNNAGGGTNKLLNKHYTELSLLTFLPAIKAFFASVPLYSDMTAQLQVLTDAADGALNRNRSFNAMIEHEEKLKQKSHLLEWERRHLFDGVSARDIVNALSMEEMPAQVHTSLDTLVAPICILTGLIPAPKVVMPNLFEGFHAGGVATANPASSTLASSTASLTGGEQSSTAARLIFGGGKSQKSADQIACAGAWGLLKKSISANVSGFKDKLTQFSPLSISHRAILRCAQYLEHDDLNPQMLSPISPLLAALAKWILLFLRLTFLQHAYDAVELTVPARLLGYQQTKALNVSTEPSPTLHVVAAAVRPTSGGRRSPPRATSPSSPGATSPRSPTTASIGASGSLRPTSAAKSRVWAQACAAPSREATTTLTAMGLLGTRFAVEAPRAPTFGQKLSARPCTAGTLRQGFAEPGPLPASVAPPSPTPPSYQRRPQNPAEQNGAAFLPSNIAALAQREVEQSRVGGLTKTVTRPQSAYVRGATQSYRLAGTSGRPSSNVSGHLFYGDDLNLSTSAGSVRVGQQSNTNNHNNVSVNSASSVTPVKGSTGSAGFRRYSPPPTTAPPAPEL